MNNEKDGKENEQSEKPSPTSQSPLKLESPVTIELSSTDSVNAEEDKSTNPPLECDLPLENFSGDSVSGDNSSLSTGCEDNLHGLSILKNFNELDISGVDDIIRQAMSQPTPDSVTSSNILPSNHHSYTTKNHASLKLDEHHPMGDMSLLRQPHFINMQSAEDTLNLPSDPLPIPAASSPIWVNRTDSQQSSNSCQGSTKEKDVSIQPNNLLQPSESPSQAEYVPDSKQPEMASTRTAMSSVLEIPGPCEAEDLIEGVVFNASYLGTTQLPVAQNGVKNSRMLQAQEALNRIKSTDNDSQPTVPVDLFISTSKIKILDADSQQSMMSHSLRSISYVADIGDLLVVMAKPQLDAQGGEQEQTGPPKRSKVICHVLASPDSHLISESVGQSFSIAYQQFLLKNSIQPENLSQSDFSQFLDTQDMYHDDLMHYSNEKNTKEIFVKKKAGEAMGMAIVESGWGSIIPTVILANLQHGSPMERNGKFSIGDQIMSINGTSLVGLPLQTCHSIIKGLKGQTHVRFNIVSCPPVVSVLIKRPSLDHPLGFSVQNGVICSLMRGGIAERGGVRVGHRIIEINQRSIVATPHDKIVQMLVTSVGEIHMKTMPSSMYRLLTGQEQPIYL